MKKRLIFAALFMCTIMVNAQTYLDPTAPLEDRVQDALRRMTLHEKFKVLHAQSKFTSAGVPRLGIRQLNMDDGPHGVREELAWNSWGTAQWTNDSIVAFPSLTCLAATWNRELSARYGHVLSEEFAFRGKDVLLGPGVNIARTPLNGRAFEYMGEDPLLAGEMVVPYIQAAQRNGVACCLKHFVLNDQETDRFGVNVNVSERALHELYLAPYKRAVEKAHVWAIMSSYNYYKGVHCCQNNELLNRVLKHDWKWDGAVISDWGGATDTRQAATGGLDIEMGTFTDGKIKEAEFGYNDYYLADKFEKLVKEGQIPMAVLNEKVSRVLRLIFRTSMNRQKVIGSQCSEAHYDACRSIGEEGIVMLKNRKSLLPLDLTKYKQVLVIGENAVRSLTQGGGSSELKTLRDISPLEALRKLHTTDYAQGYESGRAIYERQEKIDANKQEQLREEALQKAKNADLIIFVGGLNKNYQQDCENSDRQSYDLPFGQNDLIANIIKQKPSTCPIVIVTFGGNAYATPWLPQVDALLHCWYLGSESGTSLANILTGKVNPSGKLPVTFAKRLEDYPYFRFGKRAYPGITGVKTEPNSAGEVPNSQVYYDEDIFVGYRGFEQNNVQPQFPFGFGLSYTTFKYGNLRRNGNRVSIDVTNIGSRKGKETVQLYVGRADKNSNRPRKELKDFAKIELAPGEQKTVTFDLNDDMFAYFSEQSHQWQRGKGKYNIYLASSSADEQNRIGYIKD